MTTGVGVVGGEWGDVSLGSPVSSVLILSDWWLDWPVLFAQWEGPGWHSRVSGGGEGRKARPKFRQGAVYELIGNRLGPVLGHSTSMGVGVQNQLICHPVWG